MSAASQRDSATALARTDNARAEQQAKDVEDPWYRAQALAWVARYADDARVLHVAQAAMDAAAACEDPYQQAGVAAWPIRALLERDRRDDALLMLEIALAAVPRIQPNASKSQALFLLFQAAFDASEEVRRSLAYALVDLADREEHWRIARNVRDALTMLHVVDAAFTGKLAGGRTDAERQRLVKSFESEPDAAPRAFFW